MNPVKKIGRYVLPLLSVAALRQRQFPGWRRLFLWLMLSKPGYDVLLTNGHTLYFTEEEKQQYEEAIEEHAIVMQVWGMCRSAGLRT